MAATPAAADGWSCEFARDGKSEALQLTRQGKLITVVGADSVRRLDLQVAAVTGRAIAAVGSHVNDRPMDGDAAMIVVTYMIARRTDEALRTIVSFRDGRIETVEDRGVCRFSR